MGTKGKHWKVKDTSKMNKSKLGIHFSEEHKKKLSESHKGMHNSPKTEFKKGDINPNTIKASKLRVGKKNHFFGKKHNKESLIKMSISRIGKTAGEKHPNWQGGITSETNKRVNATGWKKIRKIVYERDDYQCQNCGAIASEIRIHAHHIIPYNISLDNSLGNLTTLCEKCHPKIERGLKNEI